MRKQDLSPQEFLKQTLNQSSRDWAGSEDLALIYGIINGWDSDSLAELSHAFYWSADDIILTQILHVRFNALQEVPPK